MFLVDTYSQIRFLFKKITNNLKMNKDNAYEEFENVSNNSKTILMDSNKLSITDEETLESEEGNNNQSIIIISDHSSDEGSINMITGHVNDLEKSELSYSVSSPGKNVSLQGSEEKKIPNGTLHIDFSKISQPQFEQKNKYLSQQLRVSEDEKTLKQICTSSTCGRLSEPSPKIDFFLDLELVKEDSDRTSSAIENLTEKYEILSNKMKIPTDSIFSTDEINADETEKKEYVDIKDVVISISNEVEKIRNDINRLTCGDIENKDRPKENEMKQEKLEDFSKKEQVYETKETRSAVKGSRNKEHFKFIVEEMKNGLKKEIFILQKTIFEKLEHENKELQNFINQLAADEKATIKNFEKSTNVILKELQNITFLISKQVKAESEVAATCKGSRGTFCLSCSRNLKMR